MVHAFMPRDTPGYTIKETWDTLGMRATRSDDTLIEGAFVPNRYIVRILPPGLAGADSCVLAIFAWAEPTFGSIYLGIAERARDLAVAAAKMRTSVAFAGRAMAYNPMVQYAAAEMTTALEAAIATIERVASDWSTGVDHGGAWSSKLVAAN
jgi:alkylation response protein AidB-like acyl-CoA dehydrogenase